MIPMKRQPSFRMVIGILACLVGGGVLLGLAYLQRERALPPEMNPQATKETASEQAPPPRPPMFQPALPPNATPEMKEFLRNRAIIVEKIEQMHRQNLTGAPNLKAFAQFQQDNAALLQRQRDLTQIISEQQAGNPLPAPPPLQIPSNTSTTPQVKAYFTARDQFVRDEAAFMDQHRSDTPEARQAAAEQWRQQNAARLQQLQQQAQALTSPAPATAPQ
jgi:hypothetical protein